MRPTTLDEETVERIVRSVVESMQRTQASAPPPEISPEVKLGRSGAPKRKLQPEPKPVPRPEPAPVSESAYRPELTPLMQARKRPREEPLAYSISDAIDLLPFGRTTVWAMIHNGTLPVRKMGRRSFILKRDLDALLESCPLGPDRTAVKPLRLRDERRREARKPAAELQEPVVE